MKQVPVNTYAEGEMLDFMRSQLRFVEADIATHCSATPSVRRDFMEALREAGAVVPCGGSYLTTWGAAEAAKIEARIEAGELSSRRSRNYLIELIDGARAEGITVNVPTKTPKTEVERKIWAFIAGRPHFTNADVEAVFPQNSLKRIEFLRKLQAAKVIRFWGRDGAEIFYTVHSPQEIRNTARDLRKTTEGAIWSAIRIKRRFRPAELLSALLPARQDLTLAEVTKYCRTLAQAGFIKPPKPARKITGETPFLLVVNSGPLPPQSRRATVIVDPNKDEIVYSSLGQI